MADGTTQGYSKDSLQEAVKDILNRKIDITHVTNTKYQSEHYNIMLSRYCCI